MADQDDHRHVHREGAGAMVLETTCYNRRQLDFDRVSFLPVGTLQKLMAPQLLGLSPVLLDRKRCSSIIRNP